MDSTTRGLLIVLAVFLVVALTLSALMGGMAGPGFFMGTGPGGQGMMQGQWWMWGLGIWVSGCSRCFSSGACCCLASCWWCEVWVLDAVVTVAQFLAC